MVVLRFSPFFLSVPRLDEDCLAFSFPFRWMSRCFELTGSPGAFCECSSMSLWHVLRDFLSYSPTLSTALITSLKKREGREEGEVDEDGEESQTVQEVVASIKEKVSVHDGDKDDVKRLVEQSFMRSRDCSQIENEEEGRGRERDRKAAQWAEEQKLGEIVLLHERMSQGEGVRGLKEKKRVPGWSAEEMKEKPNTDTVEDV